MATDCKSQPSFIGKSQHKLNTPEQLDSVAYQIHNLYFSIEDLLKLIASAFELQIGTTEEWHRVFYY